MKCTAKRLAKGMASAGLAASLLAACAGPVTPRQDLVGTPVPQTAATRTVVITPETRYVNVVGGDVVRFERGDRAFGWSFDVSPIVAVFALNQVAPPGMLDHEVLVYVEPDPRYYIGGYQVRR
ncbi:MULTISPECIES: CzcE family metal-binding protein [Massilia]|uniref:CzcE family metal-binding protein n=1 Tax=Massilia haematophila TaxID=457923 RepID=A0ABV7PK61_9BURK|nr:CzcE family metal-binding protein [Massilia sp.]